MKLIKLSFLFLFFTVSCQTNQELLGINNITIEEDRAVLTTLLKEITIYSKQCVLYQ